LYTADALSFDKNLVGDTWQSQYAPSSAIIMRLLGKQGFATGHYLFIFVRSFFVHKLREGRN
jgi:hypothetical protein